MKINKFIIFLVNNNIVIEYKNLNSVINWLTNNKKFLPKIKEICEITRKEYPISDKNSQLILEIDEEYLILLIRQNNYAKNFYEKLDIFRIPIWEDACNLNFKFHIMTDFQDPIN